jgi:ribosomal protein S12 methylthiotransferase accessory factor
MSTDLSSSGVRKAYFAGTHRLCDPAETLANIRSAVQWAGVSRLADLTQLDRLGIQTYQAVRPLGRLLSMTQGKGSTPIAAKVSALMEAIEIAHAEYMLPGDMFCSADDLAARHKDWATDYQTVDPHLQQYWLEAEDLLTGQRLFLPFELVSLDYSVERRTKLNAASNGLASGNSVEEALVSALCEIIERDCCAQWRDGRARNRLDSRVDLDTIDFPEAQSLIERITGADCTLHVWDLTTELGVPVFQAEITEKSRAGQFTLMPAYGSGCHPSKEVALMRAIHEAAQTRIVIISASREDLGIKRFTNQHVMATELQFFHLAFAGKPRRHWQDIASACHDTSAADLAWMKARLVAAGIRQIAMHDLTRTDVGVAVVKTVIPGFGDYDVASSWQKRAG